MKIVRLILLAIAVSPLLNVLSLVFLTGDTATTYGSLYRLAGIGFRLEVIINLAIAATWFLKPFQHKYGRWIQSLSTSGYLLGCRLSGDAPHGYVTQPLEPTRKSVD